MRNFIALLQLRATPALRMKGLFNEAPFQATNLKTKQKSPRSPGTEDAAAQNCPRGFVRLLLGN